MYCPRCGQRQISDEMRFCSRCGLSMSELAEWLAGGAAPAVPGATQVALPSPRRKGIRRGAKLMFLSAVLFPVFLVISLIADEGAPLIIPFLIFFAALVIMVYSRLFAENSSPAITQQTQPPGLGAMSQHAALPPPSNIPIHGAGDIGRRQVRTNELATPPSVTEHTTKLLDSE
jgi:hypothetical protein